MKYSIRGKLSLNDSLSIIATLDLFEYWKEPIIQTESDGFYFEAWVSLNTEKDDLFNLLKPFVHNNELFIDWHECAHDEEIPKPCVISEVFRGG